MNEKRPSCCSSRIVLDSSHLDHGGLMLLRFMTIVFFFPYKYAYGFAFLWHAYYDTQIVSALKAAGLEEIPVQFLPHQHPWFHDGSTWNMFWMGREVCSHTDYILGQNAVSSGTCSSGTPGTTQIITWSWVASTAPLWRNTPITSVAACVSFSVPQPPRRE